MKYIILFITFLATWLCLFLIISAIACLLSDMTYISIIRDGGWIGVWAFFGWIPSVFPARSYYLNNEHYFDR